jgi:hypothetical protein
MTIDRNEILDFIRTRSLAVVSTTSEKLAPEAALVNIAVTDKLELIFYSLQTNRKCINLRRNPRIAAVIGWDGDLTMQYEGIADEPEGAELDQLKSVYAASHSDTEFAMSWPGLTYFRVRPTWIRLSNYGAKWSVEEITFPD